MSEIRDIYIDSLDNSEVGINKKIAKVNQLLQKHDAELWHHLNANQLDPACYSLRWITTLLSREFSLKDTIYLWDAIFAQPKQIDFLCYLCTSMLLAQKNSLLEGDFVRCLNLLQNYPASDPGILLRQALRLQDIDKDDHKLDSALANCGLPATAHGF